MKKAFIKMIALAIVATSIVTNISYISPSAKWIKNSESNWNWVEDTVKAIGWKEIDKNWYHFNEDGKMDTNWIKDDGSWYYLSSSGEMNMGWKLIDGKWYYFSTDGKMNAGWIKDNDTWYYANSNGEMQIGTLEIDGKTYTFSSNGEMLNNNETTQEMQTGSADVKGTSNSRTAYVATNNDPLNIRAEASNSSEIVGTLGKGSEVKIIDDEDNGFYPIIANGKKAWVSSKWISFNKPKVTQSDTSFDNNSNVNTPPAANNSDTDLKDDSLENGAIRDKQPSLGNKHYYSDDNLFYKVRLSPPFYNSGKVIKGNCTWYAWGRAWELTGNKPSDAGFIGNAYEWWEANKKSGKYQYGSEPRVGAIAVWNSSLPGSGGCGHVAVVEKIENNKVYISESTWHGGAFNYREIYNTDCLYGYIYLDKPNY